MFVGKLFNRFAGTSKNGNPFYSVDILVESANNRIMFKTFVNAMVYDKIKDLPLDSSVTVVSGCNDFGKLFVSDIRPNK